MQTVYIIIVFILTSLSITGQNMKDKENEIDSLLVLSYNCKINLKNDSVLIYAFAALSQSEHINYSSGKTRSYLDIGQTLFYFGDYKKSLDYITLAEKEPYAAKNPKTLFEICRTRGQIYSYVKLYTNSIKEFKKCLSLLRKIEPEQSRKYGLSLTYENLGIVYESVNKPDSVFYFLELNKNLLETMDESFVYRNKVNMYTSLGNHFTLNNKYDSAQIYFNKALELSDKFQYPYLSRTYKYWGDMENMRGNTSVALDFYNLAVKNLEITKLKEDLPDIYKKIASIHEASGATDSALFYKEKLVLIENSLLSEKLNAGNQALQILLKEEKNMFEKYKKSIRIIYGIIVCILAYIIYKRSKRERRNFKKEINIKTTKLEKKLMELSEVNEDIEKKAQILEQKLNESFEEIIELAKSNDPLFTKRFREVFPEFSQNLLQKHPDLLNSDFSLCAMIFLKFSSKDIATYTFVEHRSIQTKKSRLRKKLNLPSRSSIEHYLESFI